MTHEPTFTDHQRESLRRAREQREREDAYRAEYESARIDANGRHRDSAGRVMTQDGFRFYLEGEPRWAPEPPVLPDDPRDAVPGLRKAAAHLWEDVVMICGDSASLMRYRAIWRFKAKGYADWIRNLEHLVRYIVMLAALTLAPLAPLCAPAHARATRGPPPYRRQWPDDPLTWQVSFAVLPREPRPSRYRFNRDKRQPHPRDAVSVTGLARRIEALRRVIRYLDDHARRCRRSLDRIALRNTSANDPRVIEPREFHFNRRPRTRGEDATFNSNKLAFPLVLRQLARWFVRWREPG